jgi:hypothetical protein
VKPFVRRARLPFPFVKVEDQGEGFPRRFNVDQIVSRTLPSSKVDLIVPESQNQNIFARKKMRPFLIQRFPVREIVATTVELNREAGFRAVKINYVAIHRMLSAKFPALKLPIAKVTP